MTDLHSHILFNVDDGSSNIEESIALLKSLKKVGFDNVVLTPHYMDGSDYTCDNYEKEERFEYLKEKLKEEKINLNIYLGNEIFISSNIIELYKENQIHSINNTRYLLIELPFHNQILNVEDIIYEIKYHGFIPIIAHPERYTYFQEDYSLVDSLKEEGVLFQSNYSSILGYYGKSAEKLLKYMLKNKYTNLLGTDIHHINRSFVIDNFKKINKQISKIAGNEYYEEIIKNGDKVVNGEEI